MGMDRGSARPTKLTARKVETAKPVKNDKGEFVRTEIPDPGKPGLFLIVQPGGRKSWAVRYRRPGDRVPRKVTLDGFPSLALAHKLAQQALDMVADGGDPAAEKQAERAKRAEREHNSDLVDGMFHDFLVKHVRRKNSRPIRETTRRETARLLGFKRDPKNPDGWIKTGSGVLARWRGRTVQSITKRNVLDLLDELVEVAPVAANRTLAALKTCFSWRVNRDSETLPKSPCDGVDDPSAETERERVLTDVELAELWRAADADGYPFGRMVQMLVLTGCRRDEVREASWAEVDLPGRKWAIPGHRTKNGHDHLLPLSDAAMAVLESLPRIKGKAGLMFSTTGVTAISGLARAKRRLHEAMTRELGEEPERWVLHDTRRSFLTGLQRLGFPLEVAEACVNHRSGTLSGVTKVYARHDYANEKKVAFDAWARHVEAIVSGKSAKVITLRRGA
jgi:integrase